MIDKYLERMKNADTLERFLLCYFVGFLDKRIGLDNDTKRRVYEASRIDEYEFHIRKCTCTVRGFLCFVLYKLFLSTFFKDFCKDIVFVLTELLSKIFNSTYRVERKILCGIDLQVLDQDDVRCLCDSVMSLKELEFVVLMDMYFSDALIEQHIQEKVLLSLFERVGQQRLSEYLGESTYRVVLYPFRSVLQKLYPQLRQFVPADDNLLPTTVLLFERLT